MFNVVLEHVSAKAFFRCCDELNHLDSMPLVTGFRIDLDRDTEEDDRTVTIAFKLHDGDSMLGDPIQTGFLIFSDRIFISTTYDDVILHLSTEDYERVVIR